MSEPRIYRHWLKETNLVPFTVTVKETDLYILARTNLERKALRLVLKYRQALESYIAQHPGFLTSLEPLAHDESAPRIVRTMMAAARKARVGPMAAVAGAMSEFVGEELTRFSPEIIIENGGDVYLKSQKNRVIGIYAGSSPLSSRIGISVTPEDTPLGIATSSGTVGHSLSFGKADAVVALASSATLADAAATAIGNLIRGPASIPQGLRRAQNIEGLKGVIIIIGSEMGVWGNIKMCETSPAQSQDDR